MGATRACKFGHLIQVDHLQGGSCYFRWNPLDAEEDHPSVPEKFSLSAYPNPFNPTTTLSFTLPHSAEVALTIRNVLVQVVESVSMGRMTAGEHRCAVNAERWASGIYFASVAAGEWVQTAKVVVLKCQVINTGRFGLSGRT